MLDKIKHRPNNYKDETDDFDLPNRFFKPVNSNEDIFSPPTNNLKQKDYNFDIGLVVPTGTLKTRPHENTLPNKKQNPLLRLLFPNRNDEREKNQFKVNQ